MRKGRFSEEQMVLMLREVEQTHVSSVAKKYSISEATLYAWRQRFGNMAADETRRLKSLEIENQRLKKLLVDRDLEIEVI